MKRRPVSFAATRAEKTALAKLEAMANIALKAKNEAEQAHFQAYVAHAQAVKSYMDKVAEIAKDHGIDVDDPTKGKWNFDSGSMKFTNIDEGNTNDGMAEA